MSTLLFSASARPFVKSGTASTPPLPVLVETPVPSRLNQVSIVNVCAQSPEVESPTNVPAPSFIPQRPMRPEVGETNSPFMLAWIADCVRATFQMRASSRLPAKNPGLFVPGTPAEVRADANAACWMLSKRGVVFPVATAEASRLPSR